MIYRKLLCGVDGSKHSEKALYVASELAKAFSSTLTVITVIQLPGGLEFFNQEFSFNIDLQNTLREMGETLLEDAKVYAKKLGIEVDTVLLYGDPGNEICRFAKENDFDLIIMGSRGRGIFESHFLGSVSDRVNHHAHCSVLIVR